MLVLSRKPGQRIFIGEEIKITVIRIGPNSVRIGIEAPDGMTIIREELDIPVSAEGMQTLRGLIADGDRVLSLPEPLTV